MINEENGIDIFSKDLLDKIANIPYKNISIKAIENTLTANINEIKKMEKKKVSKVPSRFQEDPSRLGCCCKYQL